MFIFKELNTIYYKYESILWNKEDFMLKYEIAGWQLYASVDLMIFSGYLVRVEPMSFLHYFSFNDCKGV